MKKILFLLLSIILLGGALFFSSDSFFGLTSSVLSTDVDCSGVAGALSDGQQRKNTITDRLTQLQKDKASLTQQQATLILQNAGTTGTTNKVSTTGTTSITDTTTANSLVQKAQQQKDQIEQFQKTFFTQTKFQNEYYLNDAAGKLKVTLQPTQLGQLHDQIGEGPLADYRYRKTVRTLRKNYADLKTLQKQYSDAFQAKKNEVYTNSNQVASAQTNSTTQTNTNQVNSNQNSNGQSTNQVQSQTAAQAKIAEVTLAISANETERTTLQNLLSQIEGDIGTLKTKQATCIAMNTANTTTTTATTTNQVIPNNTNTTNTTATPSVANRVVSAEVQTNNQVAANTANSTTSIMADLFASIQATSNGSQTVTAVTGAQTATVNTTPTTENTVVAPAQTTHETSQTSVSAATTVQTATNTNAAANTQATTTTMNTTSNQSAPLVVAQTTTTPVETPATVPALVSNPTSTPTSTDGLPPIPPYIDYRFYYPAPSPDPSKATYIQGNQVCWFSTLPFSLQGKTVYSLGGLRYLLNGDDLMFLDEVHFFNTIPKTSQDTPASWAIYMGYQLGRFNMFHDLWIIPYSLGQKREFAFREDLQWMPQPYPNSDYTPVYASLNTYNSGYRLFNDLSDDFMKQRGYYLKFHGCFGINDPVPKF